MLLDPDATGGSVPLSPGREDASEGRGVPLGAVVEACGASAWARAGQVGVLVVRGLGFQGEDCALCWGRTFVKDGCVLISVICNRTQSSCGKYVLTKDGTVWCGPCSGQCVGGGPGVCAGGLGVRAARTHPKRRGLILRVQSSSLLVRPRGGCPVPETGERPNSPTSRSYLRACIRGGKGTNARPKVRTRGRLHRTFATGPSGGRGGPGRSRRSPRPRRRQPPWRA